MPCMFNYHSVSRHANIKQFPGIIIIAFLLLSNLFVTGCSADKAEINDKKSNASQGLVAEVFVVKAVPLNSVYQTSGTLLPNEEVQVYPEIAGRITRINFKEGSRVKKGDLLIQLFDNDVKAQIQKLKVQRQLLITTKERQDELLSISGISKQEYDNTIAQIASIDADIAYTEAQLSKLQIRAPFDGIIGLRNVSEGAIISTVTLISTLQQIHPLKLDFPVPEQYKAHIKTGEKIAFTVAGIRDTVSGTVKAIQPGADVSTRTINIRALVPNPNYNLTPGAFANVFLTFNTNNNAITIPSQCIIPTSRDKKVAVIRNGKADIITVTTGMRMADNIEIVQGLQAGDTVLTTGIMQVRQGLEVKTSKVNL